MIVPDVNLLLYAYRRELPNHDRRLAMVDRSFGRRSEEVGIPWSVVVSFLRLTTNPLHDGSSHN